VARWVPDDRVTFDRPAADIASMFADAEVRLTRMAAAQIGAGLDAGQAPATALRLRELADTARQMAAALRQAWPDEVDRLMTIAAETGAAAALQELSGLAGAPDVTATTATSGLPGSLAAQLATADLTSALEQVTARILRYPDDIYRRAVGQSVTDVLLGLGTNRSAQARAWQKLVSQGVTGFVDVAGRRWNLATYVEMATRTAARRAWNDQHTATMTEHGIDLVSIAVGSDACQKCATWSGKVLRTDGGPVGPIEVQSVVGEAPVTVNVDGTLDEARAAGWNHPNCFPAWVLVSAPTGIAGADSRWFEGEVVVVNTASGRELTVTPNHPVLTPRGWVSAGSLEQGDDLVRYTGPVERVPNGDPDHQRGEAPISEVFEALRQSSAVSAVTVPGAAEQFHGDGVLDSEVHVVLADRLLRYDGQPSSLEQAPEGEFLLGRVRLPSLLAAGAPLEVVDGAGHTAYGVMRSGRELGALVGIEAGHPQSHSLTSTTQQNAGMAESARDRVPGDTKGAGELLDGLTGLVAADHVVRVKRESFAGHVYNLQTGGGWYVASEYIVHNCRCRPVAYLAGLSVVSDATTYDAEAEAARERLRDLERRVRKAKLEEAASVTPETAAAARATVRDLQGKIRVHVDDTGLNRKRYREQISLGRRILPDGPAAS
jgi:hypothetical protein